MYLGIHLKNLLLLIVVALALFACEQKENPKTIKPLVQKNGLLFEDSTSTKPFTGRHKSKMLDLKIEYDVVNGIKEGDFIVYHPNSKIQMIGKMKNNKNVGFWKYYFLNGTMQTSGFYNNDVPDSLWTWYYENGKIAEAGKYKNGLREGDWKNYDTSGIIKIVRLYKDDKIIDSTKIN